MFKKKSISLLTNKKQENITKTSTVTNLPPICTPNTTARAEGASKANVIQFKVVLTMSWIFDAMEM